MCALFFGVEEGLFYRDPETFRRRILGLPPGVDETKSTGEPTDRWVNWAGQRPSPAPSNSPAQQPAEDEGRRGQGCLIAVAPVRHLQLIGEGQDPQQQPGNRLRGVPSRFDLRAALQAQGLSPKTVTDYYRCITSADEWFTARGSSATKAPAGLVARYADTRPLTWSSRKELRYALRWYWEIVHRRNPPLAVIRLPPQPDWPCRALSEEEAQQLALAARQRGDHQGFAVYLGLYQAMRRAEIARCRWSDFSVNLMLRVVGKGMKERVIDASPSVMRHPYFRRPPTRAQLAAGASEYVFPGRFGGPAGPTTIWKWIGAVADEAGVAGVTPHRLRHTCLATQNDETGDLKSVQAFAGHAHSSTTEHYTRTNASNMRAAMMSVDYLHERPRRRRPPAWPQQPSLFDDDSPW